MRPRDPCGNRAFHRKSACFAASTCQSWPCRLGEDDPSPCPRSGRIITPSHRRGHSHRVVRLFILSYASIDPNRTERMKWMVREPGVSHVSGGNTSVLGRRQRRASFHRQGHCTRRAWDIPGAIRRRERWQGLVVRACRCREHRRLLLGPSPMARHADWVRARRPAPHPAAKLRPNSTDETEMVIQ